MKKIVNATYEDLLSYYGNDIVDKPLGEKVKNGKFKYYLIYENDKIIDDYWIDVCNNDPNTVNLFIHQNQDNNLFLDKQLMNLIFEKLREDGYETVDMFIFSPLKDKINAALEYGFVEDRDREFIPLKKEL
jgi:hypothetical protein